MKKMYSIKGKIRSAVLLAVLVVLGSSLGFAQERRSSYEMPPSIPQAEYAPGVVGVNPAPMPTPPALWDIQFKFNTTDSTSGDLGMAAATFINGEFWVSRWANDTIYRFDSLGSLISEFTIAGVTGTRSFTNDGTNIYAGVNTNSIKIINPSTQMMTGSITVASGMQVRHCSYDPTANSGSGGFWIGNFNTDIELVSMAGAQLQLITAATHTLTGMYGSAWENQTSGGPYLWVFHQAGANNCQITRLQLPGGTSTPVTHDALLDVGAAMGLSTGLAGGLFITDKWMPGQWTIGGLIQGTPDNVLFGYELNSYNPPSFDGQITSFRTASGYTQIPLNQVTLQVFDASFLNNGGATLDSVYFNVEVTSGGSPVFSSTTTSLNLAPASSISLSSLGWTPSAIGTYECKGWFSPAVSQPDTINYNDTLSLTLMVTDTTYARDNGISTGTGYTVSTTDWAYAVSKFDVINTDTLSSVWISLEVPVGGDTTKWVVASMSGGSVTGLMALGDPVIINSSVNDYVLTIPGGLALTPGQYAIGCYEGVANGISLKQSTSIYTTGMNFFYTNASGWVGSSIQTARFIRPNFGNPVPVALEDELNENGIVVYPNPSASAVFNVAMSGGISENTRMEVYNTLGQVVLSRDFVYGASPVVVLDLSGQPQGTYILSVKNGERVETKRLIISK